MARTPLSEPLLDPALHEDDSYGGCVICRVAVPHTDDDTRPMPFPCAIVREAQDTAASSERRIIYRCGVHGQEPCDNPAPMYETMTAADVVKIAVHAGWPPPGPPDPPRREYPRPYGG